MDFLANDERTHPYQRGRASITGLRLKIRRNIETERLVGVAVARLVLPLDSWLRITMSRSKA